MPDLRPRRIPSSARSRHFMRALVAKELRLQQITYVARASLCGDDRGASLAEHGYVRTSRTRGARFTVLLCWIGRIADRLALECTGTASRHAGMASAAAGVGVEAVDLKVAVAWVLAILIGVALASLLGFWDSSPRSRQVPPRWMVDVRLHIDDREPVSLDPLPEQHERVRVCRYR